MIELEAHSGPHSNTKRLSLSRNTHADMVTFDEFQDLVLLEFVVDRAAVMQSLSTGSELHGCILGSKNPQLQPVTREQASVTPTLLWHSNASIASYLCGIAMPPIIVYLLKVVE